MFQSCYWQNNVFMYLIIFFRQNLAQVLLFQLLRRPAQHTVLAAVRSPSVLRSSSVTKTGLPWRSCASWNSAVPINYFQDLLYKAGFPGSIQQSSSVWLPCRFWRWQLESSHPRWAPSKTQAGWAAVRQHGEEGKRRNHWAVAHQHQGQNTDVYPKSGVFPPCQGAGSQWASCGAITVAARSPSCVTATSLRCHIPPYTWPHLLTHVPSQRVWTSMNGADKLTCCITAWAWGIFHCVPRINGESVYAVHVLTWTAFTCLAQTGTGCQR